jgi:hypothetical protein
MARYHYETRRDAERQYQHRVDIPMPPMGLGKQLNDMIAWCDELLSPPGRVGARRTSLNQRLLQAVRGIVGFWRTRGRHHLGPSVAMVAARAARIGEYRSGPA